MAEARRGREGSRWFNERPTPSDFSAWFQTVPLHEGLSHEEFVSGITLIQQIEKTLDVVGFDATSSAPQIQEVKNLVYIPYAKVDTRVAYFWKYLSLHPEWLGLIEPVVYPGQLTSNFGLPPGYFGHVQTYAEKKQAYVGCQMRARILERETVRWVDVTETGPDGKVWRRRVAEGKIIFEGAPGTKIVATAGKYEVDHFSMMKAETGAVGRALGMAGMLVIPGSGIATAEDMQEAQAPAVPAAAALPAEVDLDQDVDPASLRARLDELLGRLAAHPDAQGEFQAWARERKFGSVVDLSDAQVKGVVKRLEKILDAAEAAAG